MNVVDVLYVILLLHDSLALADIESHVIEIVGFGVAFETLNEYIAVGHRHRIYDQIAEFTTHR